MPVDLGALNPQELVVLLIAAGGLVPVFLYHRRLSLWLFLPYGFLVLGALFTNLENLFWHGGLNLLEHSVANLGAGIAFAVLAYKHTQRNENDSEGMFSEGGPER